MDEFEAFWAAFPRKVGKLAAKLEWSKALKLSSVEDIMSGVERYKACKPDYADWCHPKTWLHQGRWMDEPDVKTAQPMRGIDRGTAIDAQMYWSSGHCPHVVRCTSKAVCDQASLNDAPERESEWVRRQRESA
jgi:hypothetical protein